MRALLSVSPVLLLVLPLSLVHHEFPFVIPVFPMVSEPPAISTICMISRIPHGSKCFQMIPVIPMLSVFPVT